MAELTLYADKGWESPWVFHAMVALEEMRLPYELELVSLPIEAAKKNELANHALLGKVPCVAHRDFWLTESTAISEYLHEAFPDAPRILPADIHERARARQVMSWLRTSLFALREERPTTSVFRQPVHGVLSANARRDADDLIRVTRHLLVAGRQTLFAQWSIADIDLALTLMRLVANGESLPQRIVDYTHAQWGRHSVRKYLANVPTTP